MRPFSRSPVPACRTALRLLAGVSLLAAGGCAGTGHSLPPLPGPAGAGDGLVYFPEGGAFAVVGDAVPPREHEVAGEAIRLWPELVDAYRALGWSVHAADPGLLLVSTSTQVDTRTFRGERLSTFVECGSEPGVVSVADAGRVTWALRSRLHSVGEDRAVLQTELTAMAVLPGVGVIPYRCRSTGELERRLATALESRYAATVAGDGGLPSPEGRAVVPGEVPPAVPAVPTPPEQPQVTVRAVSPPASAPLVLGGAMTGAVAAYFVGREYGRDCETRCLNAQGTLGPMVGGTILIPLGAHAANRGRGRYIQGFLASAGWSMLGAVVAGLTDETWPAWATLPVQALTSVYLERRPPPPAPPPFRR